MQPGVRHTSLLLAFVGGTGVAELEAKRPSATTCAKLRLPTSFCDPSISK